MDRKSTLTGVEIREHKHGDSIRIAFTYKGRRCRETIKIEPTKRNIKYASNLRAEILNKIAKQEFNYADYFPDSNNVTDLSESLPSKTIDELFSDWLKKAKNTCEVSTYIQYKSAVDNHLSPVFGRIQICDLKTHHIRDWLSVLKLKIKTIKNLLIPLRHIVDQALVDRQINENPFLQIKYRKIVNKESYSSDYEIDPFSKEEITAIANAAHHKTLRNQFLFNFFTGVRPEELIALTPQDIDLESGTVTINKAISRGVLKEPKTKSGKRKIILLPQAIEAVTDQLKTADNTLFYNPITLKPWGDTKLIRRYWQRVLKYANVRYRNPYQMRHTYASMLLSHGENIMWVASQMGHIDIEMVIKCYGKWLPNSNFENGYQFQNDWKNYLK